MVGKFTGLVLNLDKTIVFDHAQSVPMHVSGVLCQNTPIKYLGIYIGLGDLTKLNFDIVLKKACQITLKWSKLKLLLPARVMVSKVFIFSTFVHVCNCAWITNDQIQLIQNILNNFVWNGWNKVKQSIMYSPILASSLNMIDICRVLHSLCTK